MRERIWVPLGLAAVCGAAYAGTSRGESAVSGAEPSRGTGAPAVLVELFSSEGCSSCPPADVALRELDAARVVNGARVVALEFHVDYWDDLGWKDPFSRDAWSGRQREYTKANVGGMYTPEMVVDGRDGFVGSSRGEARAALARAARREHVAVSLTRSGASVEVRIPKVPGGAASAWFAVTERGLETQALRGENAGRKLPHGPVVRSLERLTADVTDGLDRSLQLPAATTRVSYVVFVQRNESREVIGAATL